jgi:hypothetical protein
MSFQKITFLNNFPLINNNILFKTLLKTILERERN